MRTVNLDLTQACESLHTALEENTDSIAFEELTTVELLGIQSHINKLLIERFRPLQKGIAALIELETYTFNEAQN